METRHWFYVSALQAGRDLELGTMALMELAGMEVEQSEVAPPRCKLDLLRMRDADFKFLHLLEISAEEMEKYRCLVRGANRRGLPVSEVLKFSKQEEGSIWIRFVKEDVLRELVERTKHHTVPVLGLPLAKV
jgi:hypothetical protein